MNTLIIRWADGESDRLGVAPDSNPKLFIGSLPKECGDVNILKFYKLSKCSKI